MSRRISHISLAILLIMTSAHAGYDAQRNCPGGSDLYIDKDTVSQSTSCAWLPDSDQDIQTTLHVAKDVEFITARCTFIPGSSSSTDKVVSVRGSKSANILGSVSPMPISPGYQIINGNDIEVVIRNFNKSFDDTEETISHLNVLFYLNNKNYNPGNQISCTFAPLALPTPL